MENINSFVTIFTSILLEAFPFILLGTLLSSIIDIFFPGELLRKIIPRTPILAILAAACAGLIFPVCECAIVPITGRLVKKGIPVYAAVTFMLAVPVINPVVVLSTFNAFNNNLTFLALRILFSFLISVIIGLLMSVIFRHEDEILKPGQAVDHCSDCVHHGHDIPAHNHGGLGAKITRVLQHTTAEFFDVGKFLIAGAFLSALFQTFVPRQIILGIGRNPLLSVLAMMTFAYVLSVCSESDAFIARTFMGQFTSGAILSFMVMGPMIDIKNTLMLFHRFKTGFILLLIGLIAGLNFASGLFINIFLKV